MAVVVAVVVWLWWWGCGNVGVVVSLGWWFSQFGVNFMVRPVFKIIVKCLKNQSLFKDFK